MFSLRKPIGMEKIPRFSLQFHKLHLPLHRIPMGKCSRDGGINILMLSIYGYYSFSKIGKILIVVE